MTERAKAKTFVYDVNPDIGANDDPNLRFHGVRTGV